VIGTIVAEPIEEGQLVKKGTLLAKSDDRNYQGLLNQAKAERGLAEANVKLLSAQATDYAPLHREGVASQDELDQVENNSQLRRPVWRKPKQRSFRRNISLANA